MEASEIRRGLLVLATAGLVTLKLTGQLTWSWVIVFAPVWVPAAFQTSLRLGTAAVLGAVGYLLMTGGEVNQLAQFLNDLPSLGDIAWPDWPS